MFTVYYCEPQFVLHVIDKSAVIEAGERIWMLMQGKKANSPNMKIRFLFPASKAARLYELNLNKFDLIWGCCINEVLHNI